MATSEYWLERAEQRLVSSEKIGFKSIVPVNEVYAEAQKNILKQVESLYSNYAKKGIMDVTELRKALTPSEKKAFIKNVKLKAKKLGIDPKDILDERYLGRLSRLEALKTQINLEIKNIAPIEESITTRAYSRVVENSYKNMQIDLELQGVQPAFSTIDKQIVKELLKEKWLGKNYSQRIYKNVDDFAKNLPVILGGGITAGDSYQKTAQIIRERFGVGKFEATRLIRTETNYFHNQAELKTYEDDDIEEYEYVAILDGRTSKVCRKQDGVIYKVKDAKVGVNYPPLHPNCRSTTVPVFA
jgi:SPP1 gp7 family putative phage head morphogenesis protein